MTAVELTRTIPRLGGFNPTLLGTELKRLLRNRRTMIFTLLFPGVITALIFVIFKLVLKVAL